MSKPRLAERWIEEDRGYETPCWIWQLAKDPGGYGVERVAGKLRRAHRSTYERVNGPVPGGLELDHLCHQPACVNSDHLEAVTHRENLLRGETFAARNVKKTHCKHGHAFDEANTYVRLTGGRSCRACRRIIERRRYHALKTA